MDVQTRTIGPTVLGVAALAMSSVLVVLQIVLAVPHANQTSPTRITALIAAVLECAALVLLSWVVMTSTGRNPQWRVTAVCFGFGMGICVVAAALTAATLFCLWNGRNLGVDTTGYLAGTAAVLAISFLLQSLLLTTRLLADRTAQHPHDQSPYPQDKEQTTTTTRRSATTRVKTVGTPYSRVSPAPPTDSHPSSRTVSLDSRRPPGSSGGFSTRSTLYSVAASVARTASISKTRLLSTRRSTQSLRSQRSSARSSARRAASVDSHGRTSAAGSDSFDSWDTDGALIIEQHAAAPSPINHNNNNSRFLETIPASPTTSRSPSPGTPLDQFPIPQTPPPTHRSRSFSPATSTRSAQLPAPPKRAFTMQQQQASASESHIHPLFRSDSPTPPPMASPGTVVIAAPQAGQIISDRGSIRSLSRMRSGSLPAKSSPLIPAGNGSFETFGGGGGGSRTYGAAMNSDESLSGSDEMMMMMMGAEVPERRITPPVPDFILNSAASKSVGNLGVGLGLHGYPARKTPSRDGPRGPGLEALEGAAW